MKRVMSLAFMFLILLSCSPQAPEEQVFKIGIILPLTGNFGAIGARMRNGFELANEDIAAQRHGTKIELVYEDACIPKDTTTAVQKLITIDKIDILGGSFCVTGFVPIVPILEENKIITFNTAPNPDSVIGKKYVISTNAAIKEKAKQLAEEAYKLGARSSAVIYYDTPLGHDYNKYFAETFKQKGGRVLSQEITAVDAADFRTELTKIKELDPDLIFVVQLAAPLGNLLKQARELELNSTIMGNSQNEDPTIITAAGQAAEEFVISSDEPFPKTEKILDFARRYETRFGQKSDVFAANAYDALNLQVEAYDACNGETECMLAELHKVKDYDGVSGIITIAPEGFAYKPTIFKVVQNGTFVKIE